MNTLFAESTTAIAFNLTLTKRQCNTLLRLAEQEKLYGKPPPPDKISNRGQTRFEGPANIHLVQVDNLQGLLRKGFVFWHLDDKGKSNGFGGLTSVGETTVILLREAGLTIENTNTLSVLKRLARAA